MPGMENFAPERTLTSKGFSPVRSFCPCSASSLARASSIWRSTLADNPPRIYSRQASVWMVNPGGTGNPAFVISANPAPLPPSTSFILPLPSALPPPNEKTYLVLLLESLFPASGRVVVAITRPFLFGGFFCIFRNNFREIGDRGEFLYQPLQQSKPVG